MNETESTKPSDITEISTEVLRGLPLPQYSDDDDKADYGKLLIIAGSRHLPGAAILAARAALRSGCGTVRVAAPESVAVHIGAQVPELMVLPLPETNAGTVAARASTLIAEQWAPCDAVLLGPGMDEDEETDELLRDLAANTPLPAVLDASAILALGDQRTKFSTTRILTPHAKEMRTLLGRDASESAAKEAIAIEAAKQFNAVVTFKAKETLIGSPDGKIYKNTAGTRGLGTAGSGDVLAGIIAGLLTQFTAQSTPDAALRAAVWGVHLHALCGEAAEKDLGDDGMIASDLIKRLPGVLRYLRKQTDPKKMEHTGLRPPR